MNSVTQQFTGDASYEFPISQERQLATWLNTVQYHAEAGSSESQAALIKLAQNIPDSNFLDVHEKECLEKIRSIASKNQWDPTLSPKSKSLLRSVCQNYLPQTQQAERPKPTCARKLDFSNTTNSTFNF